MFLQDDFPMLARLFSQDTSCFLTCQFTTRIERKITSFIISDETVAYFILKLVEGEANTMNTYSLFQRKMKIFSRI